MTSHCFVDIEDTTFFVIMGIYYVNSQCVVLSISLGIIDLIIDFYYNQATA